MQAFLQNLLAKNRAIELLSFKTLPVTLVGAAIPGQKSEAVAAAPVPAGIEPGKDGAAQGVPSVSGEGIYQHGIELRIAGSYNELLNYLADLERMPQRLMWNSVSLTVEKYPRNIMVLRVYTLSLDRSWLTV
jgi:MSHA biogenesis protein MshJ